jgi:hypothetical protein
VLAAILLHFAYNLTAGLIYPYSLTFAVIHAVQLILVAIVVVRMTAKRRRPTPGALSE